MIYKRNYFWYIILIIKDNREVIMSSQAKWIWNFGDFEYYHHLLLSSRRQEKGCDYPCMWYVAQPERSVVFVKEFKAPEDFSLTVHTHSKGMIRLDDRLYPVNSLIPVSSGEHELVAEICDLVKFPSIFIDSLYLKTDESWTCAPCDRLWAKVGCEPAYTSVDDDPSVFPFLYKTIFPVSSKKINNGVLYDFGREYFGPVTFDEIKENTVLTLVYGESREEALDEDNAIIREKLTSADELVRPARAFRYIFTSSTDGIVPPFSVQYEYLPINDLASFSCEDKLISDIWNICSYTFHLNTREFFLDGIKRDRWVWSGDAYQSFMINRYLYNDPEITKRTLIALLGKPPYRRHINFINDYSAYLIMAIRDYLFESGDIDFVRRLYPNIKQLYSFICGRLSPDGYSIGLEGDWVFVDWGVLDKDGPICAEQILLWQVYQSMAFFAGIFGEEDAYSEKAKTLKADIIRDYWCEEKGGFIDSFSSGKNFTSRQTNVFAVLFDLADREKTEKIVKNVFENDSLPQITTPYFKLYELMALCKIGKIEAAQKYIKEYWGGMISLGATTVWEAYDPSKSGAEHYAMYGSKFGKSLCHAWGSGPILLLGKYIAGVSVSSFAGKEYVVKPEPGSYSSFSAVVPIGNGTVNVDYHKGKLSVFSEVSGGILKYKNKDYLIPTGQKLIID